MSIKSTISDIEADLIDDTVGLEIFQDYHLSNICHLHNQSTGGGSTTLGGKISDPDSALHLDVKYSKLLTHWEVKLCRHFVIIAGQDKKKLVGGASN